MKDHDVLFQGFFLLRSSQMLLVKEVIGIYLWDLKEPLLGVFLAQISRNGRFFFEKNGRTQGRKLWKLLHDLSSLRGDTYLVVTLLDYSNL